MPRSDNGGPAFPVVQQIHASPDTYVSAPAPHPGMSLRDYFAAHAMAAVIGQLSSELTTEPAPTQRMQLVARGAYGYADAMLAERSKV